MTRCGRWVWSVRRERPPQHFELGLAPDHWEIEPAPVSTRRRINPLEEPGHERLALALRGDGLGAIAADGVPDKRPRRLAHQHLAGRRRLLQPGRHVHGISHHQRLPGRRVAREHVTGVDPDARLDVAHRPDGGLHLERGTHRPQRIVLVHGGHSEHRHQGIADHLFDRAAMPLDRLSHPRIEPRHHSAHHLRIEPLAKLGRSDHVAEEHRDRLSHLAGRLGRRRERRAA